MGGNMYYVKSILDRKVRKGKPYYFIKWQGYESDSENTWEPAVNIPKDLIEEFEGDFFIKKKKPIKKESVDGKNPKEAKQSTPIKAPIIEIPKEEETAKDIQMKIEKTPEKNIMKRKYSDDSGVDETTSEEKIKKRKYSDDPGEDESSDDETQCNATLTKKFKRIIGFYDVGEILNVFILFKRGVEFDTELIPYDRFRYMYPQELLDYYEAHATMTPMTPQKKNA